MYIQTKKKSTAADGIELFVALWSLDNYSKTRQKCMGEKERLKEMSAREYTYTEETMRELYIYIDVAFRENAKRGERRGFSR